jgi:hypothetical protein
VRTAKAARAQPLDVLCAGLSSPFPRPRCATDDPEPIGLRKPDATEVLAVNRSTNQLRAIRSCPALLSIEYRKLFAREVDLDAL